MNIFFSSECSEKGKKKKESRIADKAISAQYPIYNFNQHLIKGKHETEANVI